MATTATARAHKTPVKILGFDSWTGGSFNFARLVPAFLERGMTLKVVHIGSWGSDPGRPSEEMIGPVDFRDVSSYSGKSFDKIIDMERPDAALLLSTQTFAHRAFLRYCKQRRIPTLHLYHGVVNVQVTDDSIGSHKIDRLAYAKYVAPKLGKLLRRTFPCYIRALAKTGAKPGEWWRFVADVSRMARGVPSVIASEDARTTRGAVYTSADIEHAVRVYGFGAEDVVAVGNPDLIRFGFKPHMLGIHNRRSTSDLESVMYIDTALAIVGLLFKSYESFIQHIIATAEAVSAFGKTLCFKPHPAHDLVLLEQRLKGTGVELVANGEFMPTLMRCCACVTETTSLALVPALTGMPMLCAKYGELREQRFGPILASYPRGHVLEDLSQLGDTLQRDANHFDPTAVDNWITGNSGPLPAEEMPRRVAALLESAISEARCAESSV